jgi:hypothetical protein
MRTYVLVDLCGGAEALRATKRLRIKPVRAACTRPPGHWSPADRPPRHRGLRSTRWLSAVRLADAPARPGRPFVPHWSARVRSMLATSGIPVAAPQLRAMTRRVRRALGARSTKHWLVHPGGARTRGNGTQLEVTGRRFHAQNGRSRVIERGVLTVQLPPRARERQAPDPRIRGFLHLGVAYRGVQPISACRRCRGAVLLLSVWVLVSVT